MSNQDYQLNQFTHVSVLFLIICYDGRFCTAAVCRGFRFLTINTFDQNVMLMLAVAVDEAHVENEKQAWEWTTGNTLPSSVCTGLQGSDHKKRSRSAPYQDVPLGLCGITHFCVVVF